LADLLGQGEVRRALAEDGARADATTALLGAIGDRLVVAEFIAEGRFVVAGLPVVTAVFEELDSRARVEIRCPDGSWTTAGVILATVRTTARAALGGERVALNFLQHLSGVATLTRHAVDAILGTKAEITHTRKTTPGLRALERYAVRLGGGVENRVSLTESVMWKDNHWMLLDGAGETLAAVLQRVAPGLPVVVEVENESQFAQTLAAGVRHILADNQTPQQIADWVSRAGPGVRIQASGGITPETVRPYAEAGAALISIGALTHSAPAAAIRFEVR
jgi:nicotinate-nucleotide pyrophosphorylase (carboxylating)